MVFIVEAFFSGCISKVINDGKDFSWDKIKKVINDKSDRNLSTRIYRVIEKALIKVTDKKFKSTDILYEAIEKIFIEFRDHGNTIESVKCGLGMFNSNVTVERCENFLEKFYEGICQDDDLHKVIGLILQEKGIDINQKEFRQLNKTVEYGFDQLNRRVGKIDEKISINSNIDNEDILQNKEPLKSRTQEYADKWEENMFLNDFDEWDENAGVNIKLKDVYIDKHLPHFIYGHNEKESDNLDVLLSKHIIKINENKMLLILGQPGIGKSTLITWITVKFYEHLENILVFKFAEELKDINWGKSNISREILDALNLSYNDLKGKILILDGFDEVSIGVDRREVLDNLYGELIYKDNIVNFSLIITCRENYIQGFEKVKCKYIVLQPWNENQIGSFCNIFQQKIKYEISGNTIEKLIENKEILGIPLILYMVLALNISVEKEGSIVDIYDKIFSLDGGIYDRCIDNKKFADAHRIGGIKEYIHQISRDIAIWMFENEAEKASIPQKEYQIICRNIMQEKKNIKEIEKDFLIGNFFKLVKHCEGIDTEKLYFVHRTIYEYFVAETIYSSIENAMKELSEKSQEEFAGNIAFFLKRGRILKTIGEYLEYKIIKLYNKLDIEKQKRFESWWEASINKMLKYGMFYFTDKKNCNYLNIIQKETRCFSNLLKISKVLKNVGQRKYIFTNAMAESLEKYIRCSMVYLQSQEINLSFLYLGNIDLRGASLMDAELVETNLEDSDLTGAKLMRANLNHAKLTNAKLRCANLQDANLIFADFIGADLSGASFLSAKLSGISLSGAYLDYSEWHEEDISTIYSELKKANFKYIKIVKGLSTYVTVHRSELFGKSNLYKK